jgi:hypothetical protein
VVAFADQAAAGVLASEEVLTGVKTHSVYGVMTTRHALKTLTIGTGLIYSEIPGTRVIRLRRLPSNKSTVPSDDRSRPAPQPANPAQRQGRAPEQGGHVPPSRVDLKPGQMLTNDQPPGHRTCGARSDEGCSSASMSGAPLPVEARRALALLMLYWLNAVPPGQRRPQT